MSDTVCAQFEVVAEHEPGTLSRVLEYFVLRSVELDEVNVVRSCDDRQEISLATNAFTDHEANVVAAKIEQIASVLSISCHLKSIPSNKDPLPLSSTA